MPRPWIKSYCEEWLTGSISDEEPLTQLVFHKLLNLAGRGNNDCDGLIEAFPGIPYEPSQLVKILKLPERVVTDGLMALTQSERITISEGIISICNWTKYQSEYNRTKKYRVADDTEDDCSKSTTLEVDKKEKESLEEYKTKLRAKYPTLDFDKEIEKFNLYWHEGNRKLKNPKLALRNWMDKAKEFQANRKPVGQVEKTADGWSVR